MVTPRNAFQGTRIARLEGLEPPTRCLEGSWATVSIIAARTAYRSYAGRLPRIVPKNHLENAFLKALRPMGGG